MEHARQGFVDLSRFMMGGSETGCERAERFGGGGELKAKGPAFSEKLEISGWGGGPCTVVLLYELIVFYFSTLLCVLSSTEESVLAFTLNSITSLPGLRAVFQVA